MDLKDYYSILELEPSATQLEIKKAYRRLAQHLHPDKNNQDPYASLHFAEIKEAYEVLTNPSKKDNYLQQRWYNQSIGKTKFKGKPATPPDILKLLLDLEKQLRAIDTFRMDRNSLYLHLREIFSDETVVLLKQFNDPEVGHEIIYSTLRIIKYLDHTEAENIAKRVGLICKDDDPALHQIQQFLRDQRKKALWDKYKAVVIIFVTIIISLLIYFGGK